jgi:hypothetical protein
MLAASNSNSDVVGVDDIEAAVAELQWHEYAARTGARLMRLRPDGEHVLVDDDRSVTDDVGPVFGRVLLATGGHTLKTYMLRAGRLIIGRTVANDLQIDSRFISRHHCQIVTSSQGCVIEDLNSTNGIFVQSKRVRRHNLNDGDVVQVGQHEIMYIDERAPRVRHAAEHTETAVIDVPKGG